MKNVKSIQELVNTVIGYKGKDIVVTSIDRLQVFDKVDVSIYGNKFIIESKNEDNIIEFLFNEIEDLYVDEIELFEDKNSCKYIGLKEIHIVFLYEDRKYSILNLV